MDEVKFPPAGQPAVGAGHEFQRGPADSKARKQTPVFSGVINYFPDALMDVARLSWAGNEKHNPGEALHWAREKSLDHEDCVARHLIDSRAYTEEAGHRFLHATCLAWRALAHLQTLIEELRTQGVQYP